jgi:hypothetical protein
MSRSKSPPDVRAARVRDTSADPVSTSKLPLFVSMMIFPVRVTTELGFTKFLSEILKVAPAMQPEFLQKSVILKLVILATPLVVEVVSTEHVSLVVPL